MAKGDSVSRQAQLDKAEREHLEDVVTDLRELVEAEFEYDLEHRYDLKERNGGADLSDEQLSTRKRLVEAIAHENPREKSWEWCYQQYINGVGYTFINRLAALRCMEVRDFIDRPVTQIGDSGLTPAAERVLGERFDVGRDEALIIAYEDACDRFDEDIELLFDTNSPYTVLGVDPDTFRQSIEQLDRVPDEVWRADDVLGWVYEYYNIELLDDLRRKGDREGFEPEDVPPANQFYTPHWVVRILTDNSLGKLYLEDQGDLQIAVEAQDSLTPDARKNRPLSPDQSPGIEDFCTYLVPSEEDGEPPEFDGPEDIRVIDPACGSGHFLLYAFDVLERIWRAETNLDPAEIPREILRNNLYGVDLDMRACQLAAFNLYLKGRMRSEAEGANGFEMPGVGIVCADAKVADVEGVEDVFEEVVSNRSSIDGALKADDVRAALDDILNAFEDVNGLGSLLDVRGTLNEMFSDEEGGLQLTIQDDFSSDYTLSSFLHTLQNAISEHHEEESFLAQDLRSFVRLLDVLAQDYDVALMNPPYGSRNRMPPSIKEYIDGRYRYPAEFYISFFEVCNAITKNHGRIGMLVPRSFMFKKRAEEFRSDFIGGEGSFDFLAEFGLGILDNATVRTAGTVVRSGVKPAPRGEFIRLYDVPPAKKEEVFLQLLSDSECDIQRLFEVDLGSFSHIPGNTICYSTPSDVRELHKTKLKLDTEVGDIEGDSIGYARQGVATTNDFRFMRFHWETDDYNVFRPIATGGSDAWILPQIHEVVEWRGQGTRIKRYSNTIRTPNEFLYGREGLVWTRAKETGRRFGYYPPDGLFSQTGYLFVPKDSDLLWQLLAALNSDLYHALFLSLTVERDWVGGIVGRAPWISSLADEQRLAALAEEQFSHMAGIEISNPRSPYYIAPELLPMSGAIDYFHNHPHTTDSTLLSRAKEQAPAEQEKITEAAKSTKKDIISRYNTIEELAIEINNLVYDIVDIPKTTREQIKEEIFLRTGESAEDRETIDPESLTDVPEDLDERVKNLIHHFAMEAVREKDDGIIPLRGTDEKADMLECIIDRFHVAYGEYSEDRLAEVDDILGGESAADQAYPNLRAFIEDDLFTYHVDTMENTPILWKLSTERLLADPTGVGFACFVDYHQLDASLFDRLSAQYLDPRKAELRERQLAADRRRNNESLSTNERSNAVEKYEECTSGLQQIAALQTAMKDLGSTRERDFEADDRKQVQELAPKVAVFRKETAERIETLAELIERNDQEWFQEIFSDKFWGTVDEWRDEWLDALNELEHACEEYANPSDEPVEAHLADLFDYFSWRLKGSDHYSSTGILLMTYYFEREGADLLNEDGEPFDKLSPDERMLASLAMGLEDTSILDREYLEEMTDDGQDVDDLPPLAEYKALAEEIDDRCQAIHERIPSDWKDRALSEITTAGYQPNLKHGVAINITPLSEHSIVPKLVDERII